MFAGEVMAISKYQKGQIIGYLLARIIVGFFSGIGIGLGIVCILYIGGY